MWQPHAAVQILRSRSKLLQKTRAYFEQRDVLEVDVPVIGEHGVTDPFVDALMLGHDKLAKYLQTSPEYFMKRLLAAGVGDIFYLGKAFREDPSTRFHHHEFTMLEWYRLGYDDQQLMSEVADLITILLPDVNVKRMSYEELFLDIVGVNPHQSTGPALAEIAKKHVDVRWQDESKSTWLDLIFTHVIEPQLTDGLYGVYDYPECQSALARVVAHDQGYKVAKRFEFFLNGVELANGYWELADVEEQKIRFCKDNELRRLLGKDEIPVDCNFLAAMEHGLPDCAGVALGVDRLVMQTLKLSSIQDQRCF